MAGSEGFSVFYPGLIKASDCFGQQASTYESLMPDGGWGCPRGGNNAIDRMMNLTLVAIGNAHNIAADVIDSHAWKLREVHQTYNEAERDTIAGILNLAYEGGLPPTPTTSQEPNTVPDLGSKHFEPAPVNSSGLKKISNLPLQNLKYWEYSTIGLDIGDGPPTEDPWIGGDLKALADLANKLQTFSYQSGRIEGSAASPAGSVIDELNGAARKLLRQSGEWSGPAAQNFGAAYSKDAANVHVLSEVADKSARTISNLAVRLYNLELRLEAAVRPLAERGYRIQRAGNDLTAAAAPGQRGTDQDDIRRLTVLFRKLHSQAQDARNLAARQLSKQYQTALGVLKFYVDDTNFRAQTANINTSQNSTLRGYLDNLSKLQNSYTKVEKGLHLNWVGAGKATVNAAISAGGQARWAKIAEPIATIIFALITT